VRNGEGKKEMKERRDEEKTGECTSCGVIDNRMEVLKDLFLLVV
jgi:hypothetical protein